MPLIIVYSVLVGVVIVVGAAIWTTRKPGQKISDTIGVPVPLFIAMMIFASSLFLGFFVTQGAAPTLATWWWAPAVRVAWQFGGGLLVAGGTLKLARDNVGVNRATWVLASSIVTLGALVCLNPMLDLAQGPLRVVGTVNMNVYESHGGKGGGSIWAHLSLNSAQGAVTQLDLPGWNANEAEDKLAACPPGGKVRITVLRHLAKVIDVTCQ